MERSYPLFVEKGRAGETLSLNGTKLRNNHGG